MPSVDWPTGTRLPKRGFREVTRLGRPFKGRDRILDKMDAEAVSQLRSRINEADCWFRHGLSAATDPIALRSIDLKPFDDLRFNLPLPKRSSVVELLCRSRAELLSLAGQSSPQPSRLPPGKLLLYDPDLNLFCGGAENATEGFFDTDNIAPWDFWVAYVIEREPKEGFDSYLVSWIPGSLVQIAEIGIQANPEGCIAWAEKVRPKSLRSLA